MDGFVRNAVGFSIVALACIAAGCSSSSSNGGSAASGTSISGYIPFTAGFTNLENKTNEAGVESYKVEVKIYDQAFTCANYDPPDSAYSYIKVKVEAPAHVAAIGPGTYTVGSSNTDVSVSWFKEDASRMTVAEDDATSGTVTLTSVRAGASASGSFTVQLVDAAGGGVGPGTLSGTFSANVCP